MKKENKKVWETPRVNSLSVKGMTLGGNSNEIERTLPNGTQQGRLAGS